MSAVAKWMVKNPQMASGKPTAPIIVTRNENIALALGEDGTRLGDDFLLSERLHPGASVRRERWWQRPANANEPREAKEDVDSQEALHAEDVADRRRRPVIALARPGM